MKRFVFFSLLFVAALAFAAGHPRSWSVTTSGGTGFTPSGATAGVDLSEATTLRVSVTAPAGTVTGGRLCAFYLPPDGGATGWRHNGSLDLTLSSNVEPDGGSSSRQQLPDLVVGGRYGRSAFVACGLSGAATDGGTNSYTVTTEAWGPTYP